MKVGDKFVIEIAETFGQNSYKIKDLNSVYSKDTMDKLEPFDETTAFTNGLAAMWEIAKKLGSLVEDGGMPTDDIEELFRCELTDVYVEYSAQEVIKKLAEYKDEIRVGDELIPIHTARVETPFYVTCVFSDKIYGVDSEDGTPRDYDKSCTEFKKTGKKSEEIAKLFGGRNET